MAGDIFCGHSRSVAPDLKKKETALEDIMSPFTVSKIDHFIEIESFSFDESQLFLLFKYYLFIIRLDSYWHTASPSATVDSLLHLATMLHLH